MRRVADTGDARTEWSGTGLVGNITRMLAALPLGAVIAFVLVDVAPGRQA